MVLPRLHPTTAITQAPADRFGPDKPSEKPKTYQASRGRHLTSQLIHSFMNHKGQLSTCVRLHSRQTRWACDWEQDDDGVVCVQLLMI